jgi:hypothetical protein
MPAMQAASIPCTPMTQMPQTPAWKQRLQYEQQLEQAGRIADSEKVVVQELRAAERDEPDSVRVGVTSANLANLADSQGRYLQAGSLYERSADSAQFAAALSDLALVYLVQRKPERAASLVAWVMLTAARCREAISYALRPQTLLKAIDVPAKNRIDTLITLASFDETSETDTCQ